MPAKVGLGDRRGARGLRTQRYWGWRVESLGGGCFQPSEGMVAGVLRQGGHRDTMRVTEKTSLCTPPCRLFVSWSGTNLL